MKKILVILATTLILTLVGCGPSISEANISVEAVKWTSTESFLGIEYDKYHFGALVTNNNEVPVAVVLNAECYNEEGHYLEKKDHNGANCIAPGQTRFIPISGFEDDTHHIEYSLKTLQESDYTPLNVGLDPSCDVYFKFDTDENRVIVTNNTTYDIVGCCVQIYFYDGDSKIVGVETVTGGDVPAGKTIAEDSYIELSAGKLDFESYETVGIGYYKK